MTSSSSTLHPLNVSSVRIEDKPQNKTTVAPPTKPLKQQTTLKPTKPTINAPTKPKPKPVSPSQPNTFTRTSAHPIPSPSLPSTIFNAFDHIINNFIDPTVLRPSVDPKLSLSGNFFPVDELPPTECQVIHGQLPLSLNGAYIRNGPNPQYLPRGPYHLFDGDGMLHSIRISDGRAVLCSRYVKTYKFTTERDAGFPVIPNFFSAFHGITATMARGVVSAARIVSGQFDPSNGFGLANTNLALIGRRLFALCESDLPYSIRLTSDGDIETLGRFDFDGKLAMSMTAHPKVDPDTGEAFAFRYGVVPPFLTYFRFKPDGSKQPDVPIFSLPRPTFLHDFAITKKYALFDDMQIGMNPLDMVFGGSMVGVDPSKVSRIGVIPRYAIDETQIRWFEAPGFNMGHAINAWDEEEEDAITLIAPNIISVEHTMERMELIHSSVEKVNIDLKTGLVRRTPLSARNLDFAVINPSFVGKKNKYVYAAVGDPMPKITGVVKLDVLQGGERKDCEVASRIYAPGCYGGEPFFVARDPENLAADEDDGYVVSYVHDENTGESQFLVMDAKSPELDIVAAVKLPHRVPYGFHGLFVSEKDLKRL